MLSMVAKVGGFILALGAIMALTYFAGRRDEASGWKAKEATAALAQQKQDAKDAASIAASNTKVGSEAKAAEVEIRWRTKTLIEKVPAYVTPADDARCVVNRGFERVYDAAAQGLPAPAPTGTDSADSGIPLSAVAATDVENLGAGWIAVARVRAWERWYCGAATALGQSPPPELKCETLGNRIADPLF